MSMRPLAPLAVDGEAWESLLAVRDGRRPAPDPHHPASLLYGPVAAGPGERRVIAQVGQSLDGRVATLEGDARDISSPDGIAHLHRLRALVDAVIVGAGTAIADDPRLTVRMVEGPDPARVVIDPNGRVPAGSRVFTDDGARRFAVQGDDRPRPAGVEVIRVPVGPDGLDMRAMIESLAARGLTRILVEGGARTLSHVLSAGVVDRLHVAIAPLIIGSGPCGLALPPIARLGEAVRPETTVHRLGREVVVDCDMAGWGRMALAAE